MIHREALVKKIAPELNTVFFDAVKIINFIKSRALNSRLFKNYALIWIRIIQVYCYMLKLGFYQEVKV